MNVNDLFNQLNGSFAAPNKTPAKKSGTSAFARQVVKAAPVQRAQPVRRATTSAPTVRNRPAGVTALPFYDDSRAYQYSAEQILEMKKRAAGISTKENSWPGEFSEPGDDLSYLEVTDLQNSEYGGGIDTDLETESIQADATDKAIKDSQAAGGGMPVDSDIPVPDKNKELLPLAALAGLLYFIF